MKDLCREATIGRFALEKTIIIYLMIPKSTKLISSVIKMLILLVIKGFNKNDLLMNIFKTILFINQSNNLSPTLLDNPQALVFWQSILLLNFEVISMMHPQENQRFGQDTVLEGNPHY